MKKLKDILHGISIREVYGTLDISIKNISFDSRKIKDRDLFVAIIGEKADGHNFILKAIKNGAKVVIAQVPPIEITETVSYIIVDNSQKALALIAANYYSHPSKNLTLVGVTGTNGKTTVSTLLYQLFKREREKVGLLSTVAIYIEDKEIKTTRTTPDPVSIQSYLATMVKKGVKYCFMEVSSHGIHQHRILGLNFKVAVFTNLTYDHMDYHKTFKEYRDVKKIFFDDLPKESFAVVNIDDKNGNYMLQNTEAKKKTYALKTLADFKAKVLEYSLRGTLLQIDKEQVWSRLVGEFNAYNLLSVYAVAVSLGMKTDNVLKQLSTLESVRGRFQLTFFPKYKLTVVIDYAHTPDALKKVLNLLKKILSNSQRLITVMGCGGDRDKGKRPVMGRIAAEFSDRVILTSDNPRTENPYCILNQINKGVPREYDFKVQQIENREIAIKTALKLSSEDDVILIAGKGHELYQEINGVRIDFDDLKLVKHYYRQFEK